MLGLALGAAIVRAVAMVRANSPGFDGFLERLERRFPEVRSWLRNALEFELHAPAHGSRELAHAVAVEEQRQHHPDRAAADNGDRDVSGSGAVHLERFHICHPRA